LAKTVFVMRETEMIASCNHSIRFRTLVGAIFISALSTATSVVAQAPLDQAWMILRAGAENRSSDQRMATMRALQSIPGDAQAESLAEECLQDKDPEVRSAAALALGAMGNKTAISKLNDLIGKDKDGAVALAAAKALLQLGDDTGYRVFYAVITGAKKSGEGLASDQKQELSNLMSNPKQTEKMAFQLGVGFVPYGGIGLATFQAIQASKAKDPILKATSIKAIAKDPDPRSGKAIVDALSDEHPLVRAAAYDALARRGDTAVLPDLSSGLNDKDMEVKLTAAAAVAYLSTISNKAGQ
jgi:HEAT repeat protein